MRKNKTLLIAKLLALFFITNKSIFGQDNLPNYLTRAVNIQYEKSPVGSGFYYEENSDIYLITAAHVLYDQNKNDGLANKLIYDSISVRSYSPTDIHNGSLLININLNEPDIVKKHSQKDICIVKVATEKNGYN